jgi:hypothetical protein
MLLLIGHPPDAHVLFLGDSAGRGEYSIKVVILLFVLVLRYPDAAFMTRGNDELNGRLEVLAPSRRGIPQRRHANWLRNGPISVESLAPPPEGCAPKK